MPSREQMWSQVPDEVDVAVVGGGITGAGIARDAARRGIRVALFEMDDLAYGTSSRSSKLIHGGLRYLETYEFSLVFESVSDIMIGRTQIFFRDFDQGLGAAEKAANRMASLIGWSDEERQRWLDAYSAEVALSRRWKERTQIENAP